MKILFIIFGILILIITAVLLFSIKVSLKIDFNETVFSEIRLFGKPLKSKGTLQKVLKHLGFKGTVDFIFSEEIGFFKRLKYVLKKLVIKKFNLFVKVAGDDAAQTALLYGGVCSVLYPVVAFLETIMTFKNDDVKLICDYQSEKCELAFYTEVKIRVIYLLIAVFKIIPQIKKILKEVNENEQ